MPEREIGTIKWFGGFNKTTQRENDFGYIRSSQGEDVRLNKRDIPSELHSKISEGIYISFERTPSRNGKDKATQASLIELVGEVKWFGGWNSRINKTNDFGYISCDGCPDVRIYQSYILCNPENLAEGRPVIFTLAVDKHTGKDEARCLEALDKDIINPNLISLCAQDSHPAIWKLGLAKYLDLLSENEGLDFVLHKLEELDNKGRKELLSYLREHKSIFYTYQSFRWCLPSQEHIDLCLELLSQSSPDSRDLVAQEIIERINSSNLASDLNYWRRIPKEIFQSNQALHDYLPASLRADYLLEIIESIPNSSKLYLNELRVSLNNLKSDNNWWNKTYSTFQELLIWREEELRQVIPPVYQVKLILKQLEEKSVSFDTALEYLRRTMLSISEVEQVELVRSHSSLRELKLLDAMLDIVAISEFNPDEQIDLVWSSLISGSIQLWLKLTWQAKILCVYRAAKEQHNLTSTELKNEHPLVQCVMTLLKAQKQPNLASRAFQQAHTILQDYVVEQAWNLEKPLAVELLLPRCSRQEACVTYCEGRVWERDEESKAITKVFCPRVKQECKKFDGSSSNDYYGGSLDGARLEPICSQDWRNWSLLELLNAVNVTPNLQELRASDEYVPKLCGWVNRLEEIRKHLQCSCHNLQGCPDFMIPNYKYAKNLARYNVTVVSCRKAEDNHTHNVYLNHCLECRRIIDSRECQIQIVEADNDGNQLDSRYICMGCGGAFSDVALKTIRQRMEQGKSNLYLYKGHLDSWHPIYNYSLGDVCPKCGNMQRLQETKRNNYRQCSKCIHQIYIPYKSRQSYRKLEKDSQSINVKSSRNHSYFDANF